MNVNLESASTFETIDFIAIKSQMMHIDLMVAAWVRILGKSLAAHVRYLSVHATGTALA